MKQAPAVEAESLMCVLTMCFAFPGCLLTNALQRNPLEAPIVQQDSNWDCGIACVSSVTASNRGTPVSLQDVKDAVPVVSSRPVPACACSPPTVHRQQ